MTTTAMDVLAKEYLSHLRASQTSGAGDIVEKKRLFAVQVSEHAKANKDGKLLELLAECVHETVSSGLLDVSADEQSLRLVESFKDKGWPGLIASMLLCPAWQWASLPKLSDLAPWLWPVFSTYCLRIPKQFVSVEQADSCVTHLERYLEEVAKLSQANRGSSSVQSLLSRFCENLDCTALLVSGSSLKRYLELRGRLITIKSNLGRQDDAWAMPREGRKLKIGFVLNTTEESQENDGLVPWILQMDQDRFETIVYTFNRQDTEIEQQLTQSNISLEILQGDAEMQVSTMKNSMVDVLVYGVDLWRGESKASVLALRRIAPLQVVFTNKGLSSGLPQMDLVVLGHELLSSKAAEEFTERIGLVPGVGLSFREDFSGQRDSQAPLSREQFGIAEGNTIFVSAASAAKLTGTQFEIWAAILKKCPKSCLLLHPMADKNVGQAELIKLSAMIDQLMMKHGIASDRVVISGVHLQSRSDLRAMLSIADVYLDASPHAGAASVLDALEMGVPVVSLEGDLCRSRRASAMLRSLGIGELACCSQEKYCETACALASDAEKRTAIREKLRFSMERMPEFTDSLAISDGVSSVIEQSFDEVALVGSSAFAKNRDTIKVGDTAGLTQHLDAARDALTREDWAEVAENARKAVAVVPNNDEARRLYGKALTNIGKNKRALQYLSAALQHNEGNSLLWSDTAYAMFNASRIQDAVQALDTAIRLDQRNIDALLLMAKIAKDCNDDETYNEIKAIATQVAPDDPRVVFLV